MKIKKYSAFTLIETMIALSSWGWLDTLDEYDELRIEDFIQMHLDKGPASFKQQ